MGFEANPPEPAHFLFCSVFALFSRPSCIGPVALVEGGQCLCSTHGADGRSAQPGLRPFLTSPWQGAAPGVQRCNHAARCACSERGKRSV